MDRNTLKKLLGQINPDLASVLEQQDTNDLLRSLIEEIKADRSLTLDGLALKGDPGKDAPVPVKGVDYFTKEEIQKIINQLKTLLPLAGIDYMSPTDVEDTIKSEIGKIPQPYIPDESDITSIVNERIQDEMSNLVLPDLAPIEEKIKNLPSESDLLESIVKKLKKDKSIEFKDIKNAPLNMNDLRWHGGGITSVVHDTTLTGAGTTASPLSVASSGSIPTGVMMDWGGSIATVPTGTLFCNGASLLRAGAFAALFAKIGTIWGAADGTHFNIPDSRGRFPAGACLDSGGIPSVDLGSGLQQCGGASCHNHTIPTLFLQGHLHGATLNASGTTDQGFASIQLSCNSADSNGVGSQVTAISSVSDSGHTHTFSGVTVSGNTDIATDSTFVDTTGTTTSSPRFYAAAKIIFI